MKKLILVTLTAFAASWLLAEVRRDDLPKSPAFVGHKIEIRDDSDATRPAPPPKGLFPPRGKRTPKGNVVLTQAPASAPGPKLPPPAWFPKTELDEPSKIDEFGFKVVVGRFSASEERAKQDLRLAVERAVTDWLAADVATSWKVPAKVLDGMVRDSYTQQITKNLIAPDAKPTPETPELDGLYTLYRSGRKLDFSAGRKARIVAMYRQELANQRLQRLGGGLILALATLAIASGYIKADETTKGYYTNRLRLLAVAGLGAAGAVAYRFWV